MIRTYYIVISQCLIASIIAIYRQPGSVPSRIGRVHLPRVRPSYCPHQQKQVGFICLVILRYIMGYTVYYRDSSLSRALQARIYASHVPDIVDRNGSPPHLVDPSDPSFKVNLPLNITDPLQASFVAI